MAEYIEREAVIDEIEGATTINFYHELKRLCGSRTACDADANSKEQCPLFAFCRRTLATQSAEEFIKAMQNLQKWSNEHPKKTYAQDFFEKFPKAQSNSDGTPFVCKKKNLRRNAPDVRGLRLHGDL